MHGEHHHVAGARPAHQALRRLQLVELRLDDRRRHAVRPQLVAEEGRHLSGRAPAQHLGQVLQHDGRGVCGRHHACQVANGRVLAIAGLPQQHQQSSITTTHRVGTRSNPAMPSGLCA